MKSRTAELRAKLRAAETMEGGARLALDVLLWERASSEARSLAAEYLIACGRLADRHLQLQRRMKP